MLKRYELTPQMRDYDALKDPGQRNYVPYLMYFHRPNFVSEAINTDGSGFRISTAKDGSSASAGGSLRREPVSIVAGGSTTLGVGASADSKTLASLLGSRYASSTPWLNFGSYCFNPTQEALLFTLNRHRLGEIRDIVIVSGLNAVILARLPEWQQGEHGAFFFCGEYFEMIEELKKRSRKKAKPFGLREEASRRPASVATLSDVRRDIRTVIGAAAEMTVRQLEIWQRMAGPGTRVSYVLQPMARWMNRSPSPQEKVLFDENDRIAELGPWDVAYADIATTEFAEDLASALRAGCERQGVRFVDLNPAVARSTSQQDWLFVDRVHYTDVGHDIVARLMAEALELL